MLSKALLRTLIEIVHRSKHGYVFRLRFSGLAILTDVVADFVTLFQRTAVLQGRHVNEDVRSAILRRDEAKTLVVVEKFNSTFTRP